MERNKNMYTNLENHMLYYRFSDKSIQKVEEFSIPNNREDTLWVHFTPSNKKYIQQYINTLHIHPLAADAIQAFSESPRMDVYKHHLYISTFAIKQDFSNVRISILMGNNYVITHEEENDLDIFSTLMEDFTDHPHYMTSPGHILYHILDHISEFYLEAVDKISDEIHNLERKVFKHPFENEIGHQVYNWKGKIHVLRQIVEVQESMINDIGQSELRFISEESGIYLNSLGKSFERIVSAFDTFIERLTGIFDLQMSLKSDHMNAIMKTLTLVSVIFIPMTFIAGLYGMNFNKIPELEWDFGYLYALIFMFGLGFCIAMYFKSKGWWGRSVKDKQGED
jgi:magnesium transporter